MIAKSGSTHLEFALIKRIAIVLAKADKKEERKSQEKQKKNRKKAPQKQ